MLEIHVTVSCPDLLAAAQLLKGAAPAVAAKEPLAPPPGYSAPVVNTPVTGQLTAPLASAPTFTMEQICKAGADLVTQNPGVMPQVNSLLAQYGAQTVTDLKPEHFGAVATALRGMGAKI